jgi:hypothetical protein
LLEVGLITEPSVSSERARFPSFDKEDIFN